MNKQMNYTILYIEDDTIDRMAFERSTKKGICNFNYHLADSISNGIKMANENKYDCIVSDYNLGDGNAMDLIEAVKDIPIIVITGMGTEETAVNAMKAGAYDYLIKDIQGSYLMMLPVTVENAIFRKRSEEELEKYRSQLEKMVIERTSELSETNNRLHEEINERKKTEAELTKAKIKAEESDNLKTAFLANISHEIRTPMNGIIGFASLLVDKAVDEESQKVYVEIINNSCNQLLSIINDIVDISRIESGLVTLSESPFSLNCLMDELQMFFLPFAEKSGLKLSSTKGLDDSECEIISDHTKLRQVLNNLLINAIKFTKKGEIRFGYTKKDEFIEFFVSDTGIGIKPQFQQIIFERFRQADSSETNVYGGTGLGLSISKAFIELLDGKIWLESEPNRGSKFYFTISYKYNSNQIEKSGITASANLKGKKILVAEDEDSNFKFLNELLVSSGAMVLRAENGARAIEICRLNADLDLVLMDIKMPEMNGLEATRIIKQESSNAIPIIVQTAYAYPEDRKRALEYKCDDYISKPLNRAELFKIISKYIR
jgi:signal transduction histidine kinase